MCSAKFNLLLLDLHPGERHGLLQPLLEVGVDLGELPLLLAELLAPRPQRLLLQARARQLVLHLQLLLRHSLQILTEEAVLT